MGALVLYLTVETTPSVCDVFCCCGCYDHVVLIGFDGHQLWWCDRSVPDTGQATGFVILTLTSPHMYIVELYVLAVDRY